MALFRIEENALSANVWSESAAGQLLLGLALLVVLLRSKVVTTAEDAVIVEILE